MTYKYNSVLVVDDNPIDVLLHKKLLEKSGLAKNVCTVTSAISGLELISNLIEMGHEELLPSYVFLDIDMPFNNGFQFLRNLEEMKVSSDILKGVIVLSAGINNFDSEELIKSELFRESISKPLLAEHLTDL